MNKIEEHNYRVLTDPKLAPYSLQMDQYCYAVLKEVKAKKSGRVRSTTLGYTDDISKSLEIIKQDAMRDENYTSLEEYIDKMATLINKLKSIKLT